MRERFCEHVSYHVISWTVDKLDSAVLDGFTNEMVVHINVFRVCMELVIISECDG